MRNRIRAFADRLILMSGSAGDELLERRRDVGMLEVVREHLISEDAAEAVIEPAEEAVPHRVDGNSFNELLGRPRSEIESLLESKKEDFARLAEEFDPSYDEMEQDRADNIRIAIEEYESGSEVPQRVEEVVNRTDLRERWSEAEEFEDVRDEFVEMIEEYREFSDGDYGNILELWEPNLSYEEIEEAMEQVKHGVLSILDELEEDEVREVWEEIGADVNRNISLREVSDRPARVHEFLVNYVLGGNPVKMPVRLAESGMEYGNSSLAPLQTTEDHFWAKSLDTSAHEFGHTFGRENLPEEHMFLPRGEPPSEAVDEGTARLYQNHVFRSKAFLETMKEYHSSWMNAHGVPEFDPEKLHGWFNAVDPENTERISASPLTYPLHVVMRYELEKELVESEEPVEELADDLHGKWQEKMQDYIGDRLGVEYDLEEEDTVLQDVHWGKGKVGYFPNYVLGDIMASGWKASIEDKIDGDFEDAVRQTDLEPINEWIVENIWSYGKAVWSRSDQVDMDVDSYVEQLERKADRLYR